MNLIERKTGYIKAPIITSGDKAHFLGGSLPREIVFDDGHGWKQFLPQGESQRRTIDPNVCVPEGTDHAIATLLAHSQGGAWDFSERFLAINMGETGTGGDPHACAEALRKQGQIDEKELPFNDSIDSLDKYFSGVTQDLLFKGQNFVTQYDIGHEWILNYDTMQQANVYAPIFKEALKSGPIGVAVFAWASRSLQDLNNNVCYRPDGEQDVHWALLFDYDDNYWYIFDSYPLNGSYIKKLENNFGFERAKRYRIVKKNITEQKISLLQRTISTLYWLIALLTAKSLGGLIKWILNFSKVDVIIPTKDPLTPPKLPPEVMDKINAPKETMQDMVRRICREEGLEVNLANQLFNTVKCESKFNPKAVNQNKDKYGRVTSADWGIAQVNDYWHIGPKKDFPSVEYVLNNPEACIRWMARMFRMGKARLWVCYQRIYG